MRHLSLFILIFSFSLTAPAFDYSIVKDEAMYLAKKLSAKNKTINKKLKKKLVKKLENVFVKKGEKKCLDESHTAMAYAMIGGDTIYICPNFEDMVNLFGLDDFNLGLKQGLIRNIVIHEALHLLEYQHSTEMYRLHDKILTSIGEDNYFQKESHPDISESTKNRIISLFEGISQKYERVKSVDGLPIEIENTIRLNKCFFTFFLKDTFIGGRAFLMEYTIDQEPFYQLRLNDYTNQNKSIFHYTISDLQNMHDYLHPNGSYFHDNAQQNWKSFLDHEDNKLGPYYKIKGLNLVFNTTISGLDLLYHISGSQSAEWSKMRFVRNGEIAILSDDNDRPVGVGYCREDLNI